MDEHQDDDTQNEAYDDGYQTGYADAMKDARKGIIPVYGSTQKRILYTIIVALALVGAFFAGHQQGSSSERHADCVVYNIHC
jgi:hypothetical protein